MGKVRIVPQSLTKAIIKPYECSTPKSLLFGKSNEPFILVASNIRRPPCVRKGLEQVKPCRITDEQIPHEQ